MIALAITFGILIILALLRFGVSVEYSESGLIVMVRAGPLSIQVLPAKDKPVSEKKEAKRKARKEEKDRKKAEKKAEKEAGKDQDEKKPGALSTVLEILPAVKTMLSRVRRRLLIKRLIVYYSIANDDPYKTAITFGAANAAIGTLAPFLENNFRIKKRDFMAVANFYDTQQTIYINAAISLAVWEAFYIAFAILPAGIRILKKTKGATDRKDGHENGRKSRQDPHKRTDGNDDAEG